MQVDDVEGKTTTKKLYATLARRRRPGGLVANAIDSSPLRGSTSRARPNH